MPVEVSVFLDTSALFTGIWSSTGGARMILKLGEIRAIKLLVSSQVLKEIEGVLRKKSPENLGYLTFLLDRSGINVAPDPGEDILLKCENLIPHQGDAHVIGSVWESEADYFETLDRKHFLDNQLLMETIPFKMGTPSDFLEWYRGRLTTSHAN